MIGGAIVDYDDFGEAHRMRSFWRVLPIAALSFFAGKTMLIFIFFQLLKSALQINQVRAGKVNFVSLMLGQPFFTDVVDGSDVSCVADNIRSEIQ